MQHYGDDAAVGTFIRGKGITRCKRPRRQLIASLRYAGVPSE